jgi:hypothetical protein
MIAFSGRWAQWRQAPDRFFWRKQDFCVIVRFALNIPPAGHRHELSSRSNVTTEGQTDRTPKLHELPFPTQYWYAGHDLVAATRSILDEVVPVWTRRGLLTNDPGKTGFGLVVAPAAFAYRYQDIWDNPATLLGFAITDGMDGRMYAFNALRKMRAAARLGKDTLLVKRSEFLSPVSSVGPDRTDPFPYGDFPHPGAVIRDDGTEQVLVGVSAFTGREDHSLAAAVAEMLLGSMATFRDPQV